MSNLWPGQNPALCFTRSNAGTTGATTAAIANVAAHQRYSTPAKASTQVDTIKQTATGA